MINVKSLGYAYHNMKSCRAWSEITKIFYFGSPFWSRKQTGLRVIRKDVIRFTWSEKTNPFFVTQSRPNGWADFDKSGTSSDTFYVGTTRASAGMYKDLSNIKFSIMSWHIRLQGTVCTLQMNFTLGKKLNKNTYKSSVMKHHTSAYHFILFSALTASYSAKHVYLCVGITYLIEGQLKAKIMHLLLLPFQA